MFQDAAAAIDNMVSGFPIPVVGLGSLDSITWL